MDLKTMDLKIHNKEKGIFVLYIKAITIDFQYISDFLEVIDHMEKIDSNKVLITTSTHKKIYNAGVNFKMFSQGREFAGKFLNRICYLFGRLTQTNFITICNINGVFIAGGFMLALAHDYRCIIDNTYGYMSEIKLGVGIPRGMMAPLMAKIKPKLLRDICISGDKIYSKDLLKHEIVDFVCNTKEELFNQSLKLAEKHHMSGNFGDAIYDIKKQMYAQYLDMMFNKPIDTSSLDFVSKFPKM